MLREEISPTGVMTLTLNRPKAYNAINPPLRDALIDALTRAADEDVACIVIRGEGRGFCAGIDLREGSSGLSGSALMDYMQNSTQAVVRAVLTTPVPIITAVHGVCAGVALVFALGADHCIATSDARFSAPFTKRALIPDGASVYLLPRLVGAANAKRILLFGDDVPATEALDIGMIGEVVDPADFDAAIAARAEKLAALPAAALRYTKGMLLRSFESDLESSLFEERAGQALMSNSDDAAEGVESFFEKRPPEFNRARNERLAERLATQAATETQSDSVKGA